MDIHESSRANKTKPEYKIPQNCQAKAINMRSVANDY